MKIRSFEEIAAMEQQALALLSKHLGLSCAAPHAVMLTGGRTSLSIYKRLEQSPCHVDEHLHLLISDERYVPLNSPENNYAKMRAMIDALGIDQSRVMRVNTETALEAAAERYHRQLTSYIKRGGRITLGILGLGADGHAASLFDADDIQRGKGRYAIAVPRKGGPDRVSATRGLLLRVELLVFLTAGPEKAAIVQAMRRDPEHVVAYQAVRGGGRLELWFCG